MKSMTCRACDGNHRPPPAAVSREALIQRCAASVVSVGWGLRRASWGRRGALGGVALGARGMGALLDGWLRGGVGAVAWTWR